MRTFALSIIEMARLCQELSDLNIVLDEDDNIVNSGCYDCESGCVGGCISRCDGGCGGDCTGYDYYTPWR